MVGVERRYSGTMPAFLNIGKNDDGIHFTRNRDSEDSGGTGIC